MYDPRFRFTLLIILIATVISVSILTYYVFYEGLNWTIYISGVLNIGGSVLGGMAFIWLCTKFITFNKNKITGFEASYIDETGTGFNFPVSLSKFIPDIIAAPYTIKDLSPLEAELIGFLNAYRNWPLDISGQVNKTLYQHAIEQWHAMKLTPGTGPLHRAAALAQDLGLIYAYIEKRKKYPYSQFWKRDKVSFSRRCVEHGGLSATILATMPTFKDLGHDEKSNQKFRRAILTAIRYRDNPTSIPANCDPLGKDIYEALHKAYQKSLESPETDGFNPTESQVKTFNHEIYSYFQGVLKELDVNPANITKDSDGVYIGNGVLLISFSKIVQRYARLLTPTSRGNFQLWEVDAQEHISWPYFIQAFKDIGAYQESWENITACKGGTFALKANEISFPHAIFIKIDTETFPELRQSMDTYPTWQGIIEVQKTEGALIKEVQLKVRNIDDMIKDVYDDQPIAS
ncbi:MAG: phosphoribosylpyrophosphate synthetase [Alphaproteobacteria bacterium]|jgi:phosphoribosylpyrophosphate synthetase